VRARKPFDFWIFMTILILLSIGIIMLFSASAPFSYSNFGDIYYMLKRQLFYTLIGFLVMVIAMNIDYKIYERYSVLLFIMSIVLLVLVRVPGLGVYENGAYRWIEIGPLRFQPSEIAKLGVIFFFSYSLSRRKEKLTSFFKGFFPYLFLIGIIAGLLLLQPHLSCIIIILITAIIILFCAGAKIKHFLIISIPLLSSFGVLIYFVDYMRARVLSFVDPWKDAQDKGYNAIQSLYAIGSGGVFGRGLGKSMQKFLYLPYPHNDFIFSVVAEELGFIGVSTIIILFLIFTWRGIKVAMTTPDLFGSLVAMGITSLITVQTVLNIAVVTSSVPPTGVSLPFFSYGGTSLVLMMGAVGVLLNISRYSNYSRL
jgi:cell division protein FtsW